MTAMMQRHMAPVQAPSTSRCRCTGRTSMHRTALTRRSCMATPMARLFRFRCSRAMAATTPRSGGRSSALPVRSLLGRRIRSSSLRPVEVAAAIATGTRPLLIRTTTRATCGHLCDTVDSAAKEIQKRGDQFDIKALLYLQGESNQPGEADAADKQLKTCVTSAIISINSRLVWRMG